MIIQVDKNEVLKKFNEKYVDERWNIEFEKIVEKYKRNKSDIIKKLISSLDLMCKRVILLQENGLKGEIKYIYFSLLRTSILYNKGEYRVDLYDERWFSDKEECSINMDFEFIFQSIFSHMEELLEKKKQYGRNITDMDIENIKLKEVEKYNILAIYIIKDMIEDLLESTLYKEMKKSEDIVIAVGEYMDESNIIYRGNQKVDLDNMV
ncbi:MAG: hypothetical protein AB6733_24410 [Clostridiaceae bacterium]